MLRDLNSFTWDEFAALDPHELTYVLPIGALEQHGRHLALGADDFITKPFDMKEVVARIKAVFRRCAGHETDDSEVVKFDNLEISLQKYELKLNGKSVDIPPKELELLYFLTSNYNRVFTRDQLLDKVWGFDYLGDSRTVDVHIKRLREKLNGVSEKWQIKTVWGVGYKFELFQQ